MDQELATLSIARTPDRARPLVAKLSGTTDIRASWNRLSIDDRKTVVNALMTVTILPVPASVQRRFQKELIRIDWKTPS
ncbi:hypothetical protein [Sinomonas atrocyanea]